MDQAGNACLADFGLLTITSDTTSVTSSNSFRSGGTVRWMSPELFDPENFGLKNGRPTKRSDCYALGMVMYEVLSRQIPFYQHATFTVVVRVAKGERPGRPQGGERGWFTDGIWNILERCWEPKPGDRPRIKDVLQCLEKSSRSWTAPSPQTITNSPTTNPSTRDFDSSTEESTDEGEVSPPSQTVSSQPPQELPLKGDSMKIVSTLLLTNFQLPLMVFRATRAAGQAP